MKVKICHFREPIPVCGAWAPKSINLKANTDTGYVTGMRADFEKRVIWLTVDGKKAPAEMLGELMVPFELCRLIVPADAVATPVAGKKSEKQVTA